MRFRTMLALIAIVALCVFFIVNWRVFAAPTTLNLLVTTVNAPIGFVMLALFALALAVLSSAVGLWQGTLLVEFRRQAKELQAARALADSAEESRFTKLAALMHEETANSTARLEAALEGLRRELRETENSLSATLGEMDDRYEGIRKR
jgi:hypothetical protein